MYKIKIKSLDFSDKIYNLAVIYVEASSHDDVIENIIPKILSDSDNKYICDVMTHVEVDELPFNVLIRSDEESLSKRVYLSDLTLLDERTYSSVNENNAFIGRKPENRRFSKGERVTYVCGKEIFEGYVERTPLEPNEIKEALSYDDDSYIILDSTDKDSAHHHICSWNVFPYGYFNKWRNSDNGKENV